MAAEMSSLPVPMPATPTTSPPTAVASQAKGATSSPNAVASANVATTADADVSGNDFSALLSQLLQSDAPIATTANPVLSPKAETDDTKESLDDLTNALAQANVPNNVIAMVTDLVNRDVLPTAVDQAAIAAALSNGQVQSASTDARATAAQWLARAQTLLQSAQSSPGKGTETIVQDPQWQNQLTQALQAQSLQAQGGEANLGDANQGDANASTDSQTTSDIDSLAAAYSQTQLKAENRTELQIQARVGTPVWREEVGAKISWMIERGIQHGTLRLSPENLGPMEVRISTQNDQVSVWFGAAHADTRAALENALPRLREMFASQGLQLADAGVFREPPRDTPRQYSSSNGDAGALTTEDIAVSVRQSRGILDAYA